MLDLDALILASTLLASNLADDIAVFWEYKMRTPNLQKNLKNWSWNFFSYSLFLAHCPSHTATHAIAHWHCKFNYHYLSPEISPFPPTTFISTNNKKKTTSWETCRKVRPQTLWNIPPTLRSKFLGQVGLTRCPFIAPKASSCPHSSSSNTTIHSQHNLTASTCCSKNTFPVIIPTPPATLPPHRPACPPIPPTQWQIRRAKSDPSNPLMWWGTDLM